MQHFIGPICVLAGLPQGLIGPSSRCLDACKYYGRAASRRIVVPGQFGDYYVTEAWHRAGCHQLSCRIGSYTHARHQSFQRVLLESLSLAGAVVSKDEIFVSTVDNKRADGCIWHPGLSARGTAIDVTVWSDYTLPRLRHAAAQIGYTLRAAEKYKTDKYEELCDKCNLDFAALAANPHGGFGPNLFRVWRIIWDARIATAAAAGLPTRSIASLERRCLERLSAAFARNLHLTISRRTTNPYTANPAQPPDVDGDAHLPADL